MDELWTVEYSLKQGFLHYDKLSSTLNRNRWSTAENKPHDWLIIHVCHSFEECCEFGEKWANAGKCPNLNMVYYMA